MTQRDLKLSFLLFSLAILWLAVAPLSADWGEESLAIQEHIDVRQPLTRTTWVGTHNSYNADQWDEAYEIDPNQYYTIKDQLDMGARELTFDVLRFSFGGFTTGDLILCHGLCSGEEKTFEEGLEQIREWLEEDDTHRNSVILLKLEIEDYWNSAAEVLEDTLGDYIYKPTAGSLSVSTNPEGCYGLEAEYLSKADVLRANKNVLVITTPSDGCPDKSDFEEWVHVGFEYQAHGFDEKFDKTVSWSDCNASYLEGKMSRVHDGSTFTNAYGYSDETQHIFEIGEEGEGDLNVAEYLACGLNVFELFNYGDKRNGNAVSTDFNALEPEDLVWTWNPSQPDDAGGGEDCAALSRTSGGFSDAACSASFRHACYDALTDTWAVTTGRDSWFDGGDACQALGSQYDFAVPTDGRQKEDLIAAIPSNVTWVWVNYNDRSIEGFWQANSDLELSINAQGAYGGDGGSEFDDSFLLERSLMLGGEPITVSSVRLRAGARIDAIEVTYSDGTVRHHGGDGGSWTHSLELAAGEYISDTTVCEKKRNGSYRVGYLILSTNYGNAVGGGSGGINCVDKSSSNPVTGFFGRSGAELDALGFYRVSIAEDDSAEIFAMNWAGSSQGDTLFDLDATTAEATSIATISGDYGCVSDLDFQPGTGTLYAIGCNGGQGAGSTLMTLDPETGVATHVGTLHGSRTGATSIAFHPSQPEILYAINQGGTNWGSVLYTIDVEDASTTDLGSLNGDRTHATSIAFNSLGKLFAINNAYTGGSGPMLYTIDIDTQETTDIDWLNGDRTQATSIRFDHNDILYGINYWTYQGAGTVLYTIDVLDASTTDVETLTGDHYYVTSMTMRR